MGGHALLLGIFSGCRNKHQAVWLRPHTLIFSQYWGLKPKMQGLGLVSGENSAPGWEAAAFSLWPHGASPLGFHRERALWHLFLSHEDASYAVLESHLHYVIHL